MYILHVAMEAWTVFDKLRYIVITIIKSHNGTIIIIIVNIMSSSPSPSSTSSLLLLSLSLSTVFLSLHHSLSLIKKKLKTARIFLTFYFL